MGNERRRDSMRAMLLRVVESYVDTTHIALSLYVIPSSPTACVSLDVTMLTASGSLRVGFLAQLPRESLKLSLPTGPHLVFFRSGPGSIWTN